MKRTQTAAARMRTTARRTSPISAYSPYSDTLVLQRGAAGNPRWYVEDIRAPEEVPQGGVLDISIDMVNKDRVITPLNPDVCRDGSFSGLESTLTVDPTWTSPQSVTDCLGLTSGFNPTRRTYDQFSFEAPTQPGTYSIDVSAIATGSGRGGEVRIQVVVPEDDQGVDPRPDPPDNGGGGGGGGGGDNGDGDGDGDGLFTDTTLIAMVAVVAGVFALAVS